MTIAHHTQVLKENVHFQLYLEYLYGEKRERMTKSKRH